MSRTPALLLALPLAACCAGGVGDDTPVDTTGDTADTDTADGDSADTDTGDSTPAACPVGMSPVPSESSEYCISTYEVTVTEGVATSEPGVMSTTGLTYFEALEICAATPAMSETGEKLGYQRLATLQEWEDAGDGVIGEGGTRFPWGDEFDATKCATQDENGDQVLASAVPNGTYPDCVSVFGVYDQIGNEWEWSDPGILVDEVGFLEARAAEGVVLRVEGSAIYLDSGDPALLKVAAVATGGSVSVTSDGKLCAPADGIQESTVERYGYLEPAWLQLEVTGQDFYPIYVDVSESSECYALRAEQDRDGWPVPAKGGGAYYSGWATDLHSSTYVHTADFEGSITFRCAWSG